MVLYNCGKLSVVQFVFQNKRLVFPDNESGGIRKPKIGDSYNGGCIMLIGEKNECEDYIKKK